jgi:hypothetical protein
MIRRCAVRRAGIGHVNRDVALAFAGNIRARCGDRNPTPQQDCYDGKNGGITPPKPRHEKSERWLKRIAGNSFNNTALYFYEEQDVTSMRCWREDESRKARQTGVFPGPE